MDHLTINQAKIIRNQLVNELELYLEQKEINTYEKFIIKEMERINKAGGSYLIKYYRDVEKYSWNKISRLTNYSLRQCHRLYGEK